MRNKSFLPLMEQICMIAVFAIAAAVCLRGFAAANEISKKRSALDAAVLLAQDTCEILKHTEGDIEEAAAVLDGSINDGLLFVYYDAGKQITGETDAEYVVKVTPGAGDNGVGTASVEVYSKGKVLYSLTVAWQEAENERE